MRRSTSLHVVCYYEISDCCSMSVGIEDVTNRVLILFVCVGVWFRPHQQ